LRATDVPPINTAETAAAIERSIRAVGTPERAAGERAYLKSDLQHCGAAVGEIRRIAHAAASAHPGMTHDELIDLVGVLWSQPVHDCRMAAIILLQFRARLLGCDDLDTVESMLRGSRTWAYVDVLAGDIAGHLVVRCPDAFQRLDAWAMDANFWVRRSALLALMEPLKRGAAFDRFGGYAHSMLDEKEFFIRKAIGWVLRETSRRRPDEVYAWLLPRAARASGVTLREAVRYLSPAQRAAVLDASGRKLTR
jgi:3-methyladenine DNA glycosylase AlkD